MVRSYVVWILQVNFVGLGKKKYCCYKTVKLFIYFGLLGSQSSRKGKKRKGPEENNASIDSYFQVSLTHQSLSFWNGLFHTLNLVRITVRNRDLNQKSKNGKQCRSWWEAGLSGSVGCAVRLETRRSRVQPPAEVGNILSWRLIMKYFLRSFSPFLWFKKGSCQFLAKECAQYWLTA